MLSPEDSSVQENYILSLSSRVRDRESTDFEARHNLGSTSYWLYDLSLSFPICKVEVIIALASQGFCEFLIYYSVYQVLSLVLGILLGV